MRFELAAAYAMGIALPALEALRRRSNFETIAGYVDDFIAGGLLLLAARAVSRGREGGPALLVAAWAILCGGLYNSFFFQLAAVAEPDISGLAGTTVVSVKGLLFAVAIVCLVRSVRAANPRAGREAGA